MMQCIEISSPGPPSVLKLTDRPDPVAGPGEVLIQVHAAGVNRPDLMQRQSLYPPPKGSTDIPGLEVAGKIVALGPDDEHGPPRSASGRPWTIGDAVCALVAGGGYAELCVAPGVQCLRVPSGLQMHEAAAIPETFFTVWSNLVDRAQLASGEWLLVHGGSSGIGTTAIQIATALGAKVIVTAGTPEKCRACESLGAVRAINYKHDDFVPIVKELTSNRGVDVVLDIVGGSYTARNIDALARDGRLIQIGLIGGASAEISLRTIMLKRLTLTGSTLRIRPPHEKGAIAAALECEIWPMLDAGKLKPVIDTVLPLAQAAQAHELLERGEIIGKVVLKV